MFVSVMLERLVCCTSFAIGEQHGGRAWGLDTKKDLAPSPQAAVEQEVVEWVAIWGAEMHPRIEAT